MHGRRTALIVTLVLRLLGVSGHASFLTLNEAVMLRFAVDRPDTELGAILADAPPSLQPAVARFLAAPDPAHQVLSLANITAEVEQLGAAGTAAARRAVVAALVIQRLRGGRLQQGVLATADALLLALQGQMRASVERRRLVQVLPLARAGSPSLCALAQYQGLRVRGPRNCWVDSFDDTPRLLDAEAHLPPGGGPGPGPGGAPLGPACAPLTVLFTSRRRNATLGCAQRRAQLLALNVTAYANEYTAPEGLQGPQHADLCTREMVTVLQLRHPQDRALLHLADMMD
ncbi:hypothetical protein HYH03_019040, partial [Edaphochlamys debaryana]